ncbi:MAG: sigma-70 family RNA polymerase sigma factor [Gammaproteobacteria bacterium]|nr:sigma-70 family RNA polymerase sigma factor [Gammaproteobacteria bacterium]
MTDRRGRFEAQVMPHLDAAYRFARWLTRSGEDADDLVQEAFLRAFRAFDGLRGSDAKAWLFSIVRNCHVTAMREQQRRSFVRLSEEGEETQRAPGAPPATATDPQSATLEHEAQCTLEGLIGSLAPEHREVLVLREMEEMSYREIAAVTRVPIGTVMSRLARARAALKAQWHQRVQGEPRAVR